MRPADKDATLIAVLALLVAGATIYFWFRPTLAHYAATRLNLATREAEISQLTERKNQLTRLASQVADKQAELDRLFVAVPTEDPQLPEIIASLVAMTTESGLELVSLQPGSTQTKGATSSQTVVTVTVRGGFPELIALTDRLERNLRPVTIRSATLASAGGQGEDGKLSVTLQIGWARAVSVTSQGGGQ